MVPIVGLTGPMLLGHLLNWGLFGVLSVQAYIYYLSFPDDNRQTKLLVIFTYTIETLQIVLSARDAFRDFGSGWGDMTELDAVGWLWFSVPVLIVIISATAQCFYAWRIWVLSEKSYVLPVSIVIFAIIQSTAGMYCGIRTQIVGVFSQLQDNLYKANAIWLTGSAICDTTITLSMMYYLRRSKIRVRSTNAFLTKLIYLTMETGLLCASFSIIDLSLFIKFRDNNYHLPLCMASSKLYSNSLLVILNSRVRITGRRNFESSSIGLGITTSVIVAEIQDADTAEDTTSNGDLPSKSMPKGSEEVAVELPSSSELPSKLDSRSLVSSTSGLGGPNSEIPGW